MAWLVVFALISASSTTSLSLLELKKERSINVLWLIQGNINKLIKDIFWQSTKLNGTTIILLLSSQLLLIGLLESGILLILKLKLWFSIWAWLLLMLCGPPILQQFLHVLHWRRSMFTTWMLKSTKLWLRKSQLKTQNLPTWPSTLKILSFCWETLSEVSQSLSFLLTFWREDLKSRRSKKTRRTYLLHQLKKKSKHLRRKKWTI